VKPQTLRKLPGTIVTYLLIIVLFIVPYIFIFLQAGKDAKDSSYLEFSFPAVPQYWQNLVTVITANQGDLIVAFVNSVVLTVVAVSIKVLLSAMVAYIWQRRPGRFLGPTIQFMVLAGLVIPPAVVPTIWVLQSLGLFKTLQGLILIHITFGMAFSILLFRAFIGSIPRELDEAAIVDGAGPMKLFWTIVFPLLKPVIITVTVVQSVSVFNDFTNALYFLPGYPTVQLQLFQYQSQFVSDYNLLFMNVLLITVPPLILYIFFNKQMVAGMTSGAVKG